MSFERKVYISCIVFCAVAVLATAYLLFVTGRIGAPIWLMAALVLILVAGGLTGYMGWRALHGIRPTRNDPIWITLKLLSWCILLALFGPRVWAAIQR